MNTHPEDAAVDVDAVAANRLTNSKKKKKQLRKPKICKMGHNQWFSYPVGNRGNRQRWT